MLRQQRAAPLALGEHRTRRTARGKHFLDMGKINREIL